MTTSDDAGTTIDPSLAVVGVGASAGSIEALEEFFASRCDAANAAFEEAPDGA